MSSHTLSNRRLSQGPSSSSLPHRNCTFNYRNLKTNLASSRFKNVHNGFCLQESYV